jgi:predicted MFS family arabinose efflux permease
MNRATLALVSGSLALSLALGVRQGFGLFLAPLASAHGIGMGEAAFAVAIHNLAWGVAQPLMGAWADRRGTAEPVAAGALCYAVGLILPGLFPTPWAMMLGVGWLTGIGTAGLTWGTTLAGIGRAFAPEKRSGALGIASAGGSVGQMLLVPMTALLIASFGPTTAFLVLGVLLLAALPTGVLVERAKISLPARRAGSGQAMIRTALADRDFLLLTAGFFTCGFQLAFLSTHLPGYLTLCGMAGTDAGWALAVVGGFNIIGSYLCGRIGQKVAPQVVLAVLYALRGLAILIYWWAPKTELTLFVFAASMGLMWLGTVPLTSGVLARRFGVADLGTLFGLAFVSHQLGGFLGAWLGGLGFAFTGNYDAVFLATAAAGLVAAAFNLPIKGQPHALALRPA